jgi:hypothetical protein
VWLWQRAGYRRPVATTIRPRAAGRWPPTSTIADGVAGRHVVTIVCGSNVDLDAYHRWVAPATP